MAVPLSNTFEGGSDGTTITTGNSGGVSGNAFDLVTIGATHTVAYSSGSAISQTLSALITPGGTSGTSFVQWGSASVGTIGPTVYTRFYWRNVGAFSSTNCRQQYMEGAGGSALRCALTVNGTAGTPGKFSWVNSAGTAGTLSTSTLAIDTTYRFECKWTLDASVGQAFISVFVGDSATPLETLVSPATQNFGAANMDTISWGNVSTNVTNLTQAPTVYDGLAIGTAGYFGAIVDLPAGREFPQRHFGPF